MVSPATTACEYGPPAGAALSALIARLGMSGTPVLSWELVCQAVRADQRGAEQRADVAVTAGEPRALRVGERDPPRHGRREARGQCASPRVRNQVYQSQ